MLSNETVSVTEIAQALGRKESWLKKNWLAIHQADGFPRKIAYGWVWPRRQVEAWLRAGGAPAFTVQPANDDLPENTLIAATEALSSRYGGPQ